MLDYVKIKDDPSEKEMRWFFQQLIIGVDHCHQMEVVRPEIKLEDALLDSGRRPLLKISPFRYNVVSSVVTVTLSFFGRSLLCSTMKTI